MAPKESIKKFDSSRTRLYSIRVTHTQHTFLKTKLDNKASALVRVLLNMYLNGRIPEADLLLEHEVARATEAQKIHNGINISRLKLKGPK